MAYGKRKKGGQRLMEIARAGAKRRAVKKERTAKNFGVGSKNTRSTPSRGRTKVQITMAKPKAPAAKTPKKPAVKKPVAKKPAAKKPAKTDAQKLANYRKNPTKGMAPRNLRTEAQRAAERKRLMNQMSEARGMSKLAGGLTKDLADAEFATKLAIEVGAAPIGGGLASGAARKVAKTALGKKVKEQVAKRGFTKEGKRLKKAGNYRDTKGRVQKINPKKDKSKNVFLGGAKKKSKKSDAIEVDVYGPRTRSTFNPKGEPATKGAAKPKPTPKTTKRSTPKGDTDMISKDKVDTVLFGIEKGLIKSSKVKAKPKAKTPSKKKVAKKKATKPVNKPGQPKDNKVKQAKRKSLRRTSTPKTKAKPKAKTKKPSVLKKGVNKAKNPQTKFKQDQLKRNMKKRGKR